MPDVRLWFPEPDVVVTRDQGPVPFDPVDDSARGSAAPDSKVKQSVPPVVHPVEGSKGTTWRVNVTGCGVMAASLLITI